MARINKKELARIESLLDETVIFDDAIGNAEILGIANALACLGYKIHWAGKPNNLKAKIEKKGENA